MSREIKYRGFIRPKIEDGEVIYTGGIENISRIAFQNNKAYVEYTGWFIIDVDIVLLQYTGLNDKDGDEIYEGDVLVDIKASGNDKIPRVVRYDEEYALYRVPFIRNHGAWGMSNLDLGFLLRNNPDRYEIIGNKYENPELLEGESNG